MVLVTNKEYYMDGTLANNLAQLKQIVKKDWDVVIIIDGGEGTGKSVLAQQIAYFFDESFTEERMTIGLDDFEKQILNAKPGQAVVGDEMMRLLHSKSAMTHINKRIVELLAEVRQKNLFIILVMPSFFDMDKYAALWRSTALIHCYTGDGRQRGYFGFYTEQKKKILYLTGKKLYDYYKVRPDFIGRFSNKYVISEEVYRDNKLTKLGDRPKKAENAAYWKKLFEEEQLRFKGLAKRCHEDKVYTYEEIGEASGMSRSGVHRYINEDLVPNNAVSLENSPSQTAFNSLILAKQDPHQKIDQASLKAQGGTKESPINL